MDKNSPNINLLKIVASFMVMLIHVSAVNFPKLGKAEWDVSNFYNSFSRVCVPIFFMISGYFLITRDESATTFYKKRFTKIIPPLVFWSGVFYLYNYIYIGAPLYNATELFNCPASAHLWFLYAMFGLYLFTPFISKIYNNSSAKERLIFIGIWFVTSSIIPVLNSTFGMTISTGLFQLTTIYGYIGFFFIGAWIKDNQSKRDAFAAVASLFLYMLLSLLTMYLTKQFSYNAGKPNGTFYSYLSPFVIIGAIALFYFFISIKIDNIIVVKISNVFSSFALGVYCIHTLFIWPLAKEFHIGGDVNPTEYYILITTLIVFSTSCIFSYFGSKIPFVKRVF